MGSVERRLPGPDSSRYMSPVVFWGAVVIVLVGLFVKVYHYWDPPMLLNLVKWVYLGSARDKASDEKKLILYDFTANWCPPCRMMKKEVFSNSKHAEWINDRYVAVQVFDFDDGKDAEELRKKFKVESYPTLVLASSDGKHFRTIQGYRGAEVTMGRLKMSQQSIEKGIRKFKKK